MIKDGKGLNLKTLLDHPPDKFTLDGDFAKSLADKYYSEKKDVDIAILFSLLQVFGDTATFAYAAWFN